MSDTDDQIEWQAEGQVSEDTQWIERLTDAASDYEAVGAEAAAGLGLGL